MRPADSVTAVVDAQVRQRATEIREQWSRDLAVRIANVLGGHGPDGK